ncbi:MAG: DUF1684 domain-containing protein [Pseudomonadota bacterium]
MKQLQLADWRRQVAEIYADVRASDNPRKAWEAWKEARAALFASHPQSPNIALSKNERGKVHYYPYNADLRYEVGLTPLSAEPKAWPIGKDGVLHVQAFARTDGLAEACGKELHVFWIAGYGGGLFLPFADETSGIETYGGGRYVLDTIKGADLGMASEKIVVDFNFAYYPSCAHSEEWVCPLAPADNRLPVRIAAGQRDL